MKPRKDGRYVKKKVINGKSVFFYSDEKTERAAQKDIDRQMLDYAAKIASAAKFRVVAAEWKADHIEKISHRTWCGYAAHYRGLYSISAIKASIKLLRLTFSAILQISPHTDMHIRQSKPHCRFSQ